MTRIAIAAAVLLLIVGVGVNGARAQAAPSQTPDVQRLAVFHGTWNVAGESKAQPAGPYNGSMTCEWFTGQTVLICKGSATGAVSGSEMHLWSYDGQDKAYNWYSLSDRGGSRSVMKVQVSGKTWNCDREGTYQKKPAKFHYEWVEESPTVIRYRHTRAVDGAPPEPVFEVTLTKGK